MISGSKLYHTKDIVLDRIFSKFYQKKLNDYLLHGHHVISSYDHHKTLKLNKICCIEDWENREMKESMNNLGYSGYIHRKDWEWAMGLIAMRRLNKLNEANLVLGVGSGKEKILFYLANDLVKHLYATDIYSESGWEEAPADFIESPEKYAEQKYNLEKLTAMNMDGRNLTFDSNYFDVVFSFSSIEHFGGKRHEGALKSVQEMERVLKPGGIAVIATEYILNNKDHQEFYNERSIYSDLIDKLDRLKLVEPLDENVTERTIGTAMNFFPDAINWNRMSDEYKKNHPHVVIRIKDIIHTSVMLVFRKS